MFESVRKWLLTLSALMFGAGVFLIGLGQLVPAAIAQDDVGAVMPTCEVVSIQLTDKQTAQIYTDFLTVQINQGRDDFMTINGPFPILCAW
ncbi:MAG: hypothetical protein AAFV53_26225 [Myxococcota bacterium]